MRATDTGGDSEEGVHSLWQAHASSSGFKLTADVVQSGQALLAIARACLTFISEETAQHCRKYMPFFPSSLSYGSACSGSGMDEKAMRACEKALAEHGVETDFECLLCCEINSAKRQWLMNWEGDANTC
eukprot:6478105-Amphidinium_carterae.2